MTSDIKSWLADLGMAEYIDAFVENGVDETLLPELNNEDLKDLGVNRLKDRKIFLSAIAKLDAGAGGEQTESTGDRPAPQDDVHAERRQLTLMFVDLVGSTALSRQVDPEDLRAIITNYQNVVAGAVTRFDGNVAKYMGDGVLCYFGWPRAHEDDPERAVRAGLDILHGLTIVKGPQQADLAARIGIATGLVVVGDLIGEGTAQEEAVVGEAPNLAARLQSLAEPGQIVVSETTRKLLGGAFDLADLGQQTIKGIAGTVSIFRVVGERATESRFEAHVTGPLRSMVGRDHELNLILERWRQTKSGEGQLLLLNGEAGIGKSRIVRAAIDKTAEEPHHRISYQCSPYHSDSAFYPVIQQLTFAAGIQGSDGNEQRLDKLEALLTGGDVRLIAALLGLDVDKRFGPLELTPQQQRARTLQALTDELIALSRDSPVQFIIEDGHWIDASTLELLDLCVDRITSERVFILITARPEFDHAFGGYPNVSKLALNRLARDQVAAIVSSITGDKPLPDELMNDIAERTDGVPLFVEELTKAVLETGDLRETETAYEFAGPASRLAVPVSLADSLMARLDRDRQAKEVAQIAACIGRQFDYALLEHIIRKDLVQALDRLCEAELLFRRGRPPDASYTFKHALVQDAAYESLLKNRRQQIHADVAGALRKRFPEIAETQPEVLAHHLTESGLLEEAIAYWHRAGEHAVKRSAFAEATAHFTKGLELVRSLPEGTNRDKIELSMQLALGPVIMTTKGWAASDVEQTFLRARELARRVGEPAQLFTVTWNLWHLHQALGKVWLGRDLIEELLELARGQSDSELMLQAHHAAWTTLFHLADFPACRDHAEQGRSLYDAEAHRAHKFIYGGHDPGVCACNHGACALWLLGYPDQAVERAREGQTLSAELAHPLSRIATLVFASFLHQFRREPQATKDLAEATIALCTEQDMAPHFRETGVAMRGWSIATLGQVEDGMASIRKAIDALAALRMVVRRSYFLTLLADTYASVGQFDEGLAAVREALELIERTGEQRWEAEVYRLNGTLLGSRSTDDREESEACFKKAIEIARRQNSRSLELRAATSLARIWAEEDKRTEAYDLLAPVYGWFMEGFDTPDLIEAKALLDELN
jgi:class 3 adenylate cyclase/predicted ATPase